MRFEEELPELRKSKNPLENVNERHLVQVRLMAQDPEGPEAWVLRYAATFAKLYDLPKNEDGSEVFHELVVRAHHGNNPELYRQIQERLDAETLH